MGFPVWNFSKGRYRVRFSDADKDLKRCLALRARVFRKDPQADDGDAFDARCLHVLIEEVASGQLACCFRILHMRSGAELPGCYATSSYDLSKLQAYPGKLVELGRFCVAPEVSDPDVLRVAWGALTGYVDKEDISMLIGCSSFQGTKVASHAHVFEYLFANHLAPDRWQPEPKAAQTIPLCIRGGRPSVDDKEVLADMPPLLRSYLMMGGWVSDHAVVDTDLDTLHVFTAVEVASIPETRKRLLRAVAG